MTYQELADLLIRKLEGCRLTGYADGAGYATNGYGHRGPEVRIGQAITMEIAIHNEVVDRCIAENRLVAAVGQSAFDMLADHQKAALLSFVFNLGAEPGWTIWADVKAGRLADVPAQMARFDKEHKDGKIVAVPGLDARRAAEIAYWNTADLGKVEPQPAVCPPSGYCVAAVTPPTPAALPPGHTTSELAKVAAIAASVVAVVAYLTPTVQAVPQLHALVPVLTMAATLASAVSLGISKYQAAEAKL